jgi:flotillin
MDKRAAAFAAYNDAAVLQMLIEVLPQLAREVAAPMAAIDKLTVVSTDGAGEVPKQVTNNVVQTLELLKNTTGVDLQTLVSRYTDGNGQSSVEQA